MKNLVQRFILLCLFMTFSGLAIAADIPNNTIYYTSSDGKIVEPYGTNAFGVNIISNTYENGQGTITFDGDVTSFGERAFDYCKRLTSITIPNSVTSIGNDAFVSCSGLISITIPNSVTSIGNDAFHLCEGLTSITIPNSVTSIGRYAFYGCSRLTSITIPNSVESIGKEAFMNCPGLTSITVEKGNVNYDSRNNCNAIIETATNTLIRGCKNTIIPNSVTCIGSYAFSKCRSLTSITIPNSVTSIEAGAFSVCTNLTTITFSNSVTSIGNAAFNHCERLTSVTIPNSVTSIGWRAFWDCSSLTSITLGSGLTSIGDYAFEGCSGLTSITVENGNAKYDSRNNCNAIIETATNTLIRGCENTIILNSVTNIGHEAFDGCSGLTSIIIPNSVTSIGDYAFRGCSGLTSITIPNSVTSIENSTFSGCSGLTSVTIPNSVTSIGADAFRGCSSLTSITIPNSVESISVFYESHAFSGCSGLASITVENGNTKYDSRNNCNAIIETASNTLIRGCENTIIPNSVTSIGNYAFDCCERLTSITIPNSVTSIGDGALGYCSGLTSITVENGNAKYDSRNNCNAIIETATNTLIRGCENTIIPNSVTNIGREAFDGCSGLTSIIIPNSVTSIGFDAFKDCSSLTSIIVEKGNTKYDSRNDCNAIIETATNALIRGCENTIIPNSLVIIDLFAFSGCSGLTSVTIPNSVTRISNSAFDGCTGLTSVTIPNSVTEIRQYAFRNCENLTSVTNLSTTPLIISSNSVSCDVFTTYGILHVLPGCKEAYENAEYWNDFTIVEDAIDPFATIALVDGKTYNNETTQDNKEISYTRTFGNTSWQALYVPFSMSYEDWKDDFDVSYINGIRQYDKDEDGVIEETVMDVIMIKNGSLIPNTPYLIRAKTTGEKSITINNATLYKAEDNSIDCSTTIAKYTFTGTYTPIPASVLIENNYYAMGGGALVISNGSDLKPYRWYMQIDARSPLFNISDAARRIIINLVNEDDVVSGITEYTNTQHSSSESQIYDLNGRKVSMSALKAGVYIKNGKKVVIKNKY